MVSDTNDASHGKKQSQSEHLVTDLLKVDDGSRVLSIQHFMFSRAPPHTHTYFQFCDITVITFTSSREDSVTYIDRCAIAKKG